MVITEYQVRRLYGSVVVKYLRLEDKDKDLSEDKDKDLRFKDKDL